jgi:hypothetical protein
MDKKTKNYDLYCLYELLSPLFHQAPNGKNSNNKSFQRMAPIVGMNDVGICEVMYVPAVSGNNRRGVTRKDFMLETLKVLGLYENWQYSDKVKSDVYLALLNGGTLNAGSSLNVKIDVMIQLYDTLPFFGLLGGCYGQIWFPGRLSTGFGYMLTPEVLRMAQISNFPYDINDSEVPKFSKQNEDGDKNIQTYTRRKIPGLISQDKLDAFLQNLQDDGFLELAMKVSELAADQTDESIKDEIKIMLEENPNLNKFVGNYFRKGPKIDGLIKAIVALTNNQMIYEFRNTIPAGAKLFASDYLLPGYGDDNLYEATFHAFMETMCKRPFVGGLAAKGYGRTKLTIKSKDGKDLEEFSRAKEYWEWLKKNKGQVCEFLVNVDEHLFGKAKKKNKE